MENRGPRPLDSCVPTHTSYDNESRRICDLESPPFPNILSLATSGIHFASEETFCGYASSPLRLVLGNLCRNVTRAPRLPYDPNDLLRVTRSTNKKVTSEYHAFDHIPSPSDEPAAVEDLISRRSGPRGDHRSRLLIIIAAVLVVKSLLIQSLVIPYFGPPYRSSPLFSLCTSQLMAYYSSTSYSRETVIDLASGSVTGTYSSCDLLSIHTTPDSINIILSIQL